ncbi:hypothetical protein HPP92_012862 [Vanilla planifolia]|uniref:FAF domain-containing protein n=1 Tax=Vanilla planifolia TaxID=51239 RepID=A0A835QUE1_VANPL|nr:hypothetical protein HPP92_013316 [Vanilla planifolia]KAG0478143.1 hypothetical protein HPP92_012862 [Vanilla planifolia]
MAVAVCHAFLHHYQQAEFVTPAMNVEKVKSTREETEAEEDKERFDIWSSIQKEKEKAFLLPASYVNPLVRRTSIIMGQKSLETCTENLGSENGSDGFSSGDELDSWMVCPFFSISQAEDGQGRAEEEETKVEDEAKWVKQGRKELSTVNYHCSIGRRSPVKSFPPPLPSISSREGPCLKMLPYRREGRLVVEAVPVPSHNYLHAERHGGRLLLSFIDCSSRSSSSVDENKSQVCEEEEKPKAEVEEQVEVLVPPEEEDEEVEEEVEVVDRGTVVEVKVSTQPQTISGMTAIKVLRSYLVINKFVIGTPLTPVDECKGEIHTSLPPPPQARPCPAAGKRSTTTAAAAAVAASSISTSTTTTDGFHYHYLADRRCGSQSSAAAAAADARLLFSSKRRSREELLHDMQRCSELRRPLFIFEQPSYCIATST